MPNLMYVLCTLVALHGLFFLVVKISFKEVKGRRDIAQTLHLPSHVDLDSSNPQPFTIEREVFLPARTTGKSGNLDQLESSHAIRWANQEPAPTWWHNLPIRGPLMPLKDKMGDEEILMVFPKVFWRGEVFSYVKETVPISIEWQGDLTSICSTCSAYTLRYRVQVDLAHGRLLCLEPIEQGKESVAAGVRTWLWQHRFDCVPEGRIVSGEVELCFNGEYVNAAALY